MFLKKERKLQDLGFMVDCSRGAVLKIPILKKLVDYLSAFGYTYLQVYLEDMYEMEGEPCFGYMRGRYSKQELKELDDYCKEKGLELIIGMQTLAHLERITKYPCYSDLFDCTNILLVGDEKVYAFIDKMLATLSSYVTSRKINIGCDEAFMLGRGRYIEKYGYEKTGAIFLKHIKRVAEIAEKYGYTCYAWGDMMEKLSKEIGGPIQDMPKNVIPVKWLYCSMGKEKFAQSIDDFPVPNDKMSFAGACVKHCGFVPENHFSIDAVEEQVDICIEKGVKDYLLTSWGDGEAGTSTFAVLPTIFYCAVKAHGMKLNEETKAYFKQVIGVSYDDFILLDEPNYGEGKEYKGLPTRSFCYLYNDVFQNIAKDFVIGNAYEVLMGVAKRLGQVQGGEFTYLFDSLKVLCEVIAVKANLGNEIRTAYNNKKTVEIQQCIEAIQETKKRLTVFIQTYEKQWLYENKGFGFEKICVWLGGVQERLNYCERRLQEFADGDIPSIDELEESVLPFPYWEKKVDSSYDNFTDYASLVSGGNLM